MITDIILVLSLFIQLLIIVGPISPIALFPMMIQGMDSNEIKKQIMIAMGSASAVSFAFIYAGDSIMEFLGITYDGFKLGGSIILIIIAIMLIFGFNDGKVFDGNSEAPGAVMGVPIIVGPGCLVGIGMLVHDHGMLAVALSNIAVMAFIAAELFLAKPLSNWLGDTGMEILLKLSGIYVAALGGGAMYTCLTELLVNAIKLGLLV
jgi:multiple antibiotic resistance protein